MLKVLNPNSALSKFINKVPFILQIIIGMVVGILLALVVPSSNNFITLLGDLFVSGLKAIAPLLVFVLVSASIARHKIGTNTKLKPIIVLYIISMC